MSSPDIREAGAGPGEMHGAPNISVVIPVHNRKDLLGRALDSLQAQIFEQFEVVVVDDGSQDDLGAVVRSFDDPRIRLIRQQHEGAAAARNRGVEQARARLITFLDSDDEAYPEWLDLMVRGLKDFDIVCCGLLKVYQDSRRGPQLLLPSDMGPMFGRAVGRFTHCGVFALERELFLSVGGYAKGLRSGQHSELAMRLLPRATSLGKRVYNVMQPLIRVNVHRGSRIRSDPLNLYLGSKYTLEAHAELFARDPQRHAQYLSVAGVNAARLGYEGEAASLFRRAVKVDPATPANWGRWIIAQLPPVSRRVWRRAEHNPG